MAVNQFIWYNTQVKQLFTNEEIHTLMKKSDGRATWEILQTWLWIIAAMAMVHYLPNVITVVIALWIIGGKQLACAIILHDAGHYSLFNSKQGNIVMGNWLGAYPIFHNVDQYRPYHLEHHKMTGTDNDPDVFLTRGYPTTKKSMMRKFARDLFGITGIKATIGLLAMHVGLLEYNLGNKLVKNKNLTVSKFVRNGWKNLRGPILFQVVMIGILYICGNPWLYGLWIGANLFTYPFCIRVRSMAEHSMVPDRNDPQVNSRTVKANFIEQILFAPLHVNYHVEHHLLMGVPSYRFPKMHQMLVKKGFFEKALYAKGYAEIIRMAYQKK
jgi:fatty acid desaturase